ncbi:hypothetical protein HDU84_000987 [Entophlyctis sp. JEL0112]|nr:hypothetical protein HDU84_000987 [Entophlyctis sp. JEL0112]
MTTAKSPQTSEAVDPRGNSSSGADAVPRNPAATAAVRNRRFVFVSRLEAANADSGPLHPTVAAHADYFSLQSIRARRPHVYALYLGAASLPASQAQFPDSMGLVDRILSNMDHRAYLDAVGDGVLTAAPAAAGETAPRLQPTPDNDEGSVEEFDSDDDEGRLEYEDRMRRKMVRQALERSLSQSVAPLARDCDDMGSTSTDSTSDRHQDSQAEMEAHIVRIMRERFIAGGDAEFFDYSCVDNDPAFDDWNTVERDAQEIYFDTDGNENSEGGSDVQGEHDDKCADMADTFASLSYTRRTRSKAEWPAVWENGRSVNNLEYDY